MDLTGGIDSRMVFAASTCIDEINKKVKIYTAPNYHDKDFHIAVTLADTYNFEYDFERIAENGNYYNSFEKMLEQKNSLYMHKSLDKALLFNKSFCNDKKVVFNGGAGENLRGYYVSYLRFSWDWENEPNILNSDFDINLLFELLNRKPLLGEKVKNLINKQYVKSMSNKSGISNFEKMHSMWLYYMDRYHFSAARDGGYNMIQWSPLMSKNVIRAFRKSFGKVGYSQFIFDLLYTFNPIVANHEFKDQKYRNRRNICQRNSTVISCKNSYEFPSKTTFDRYERLKDDFNEKKVNDSGNEVNWLDKTYEKQHSYMSNSQKVEFLRCKLIELLFTLIDFFKNDTEFDKDIGVDLFYYITDYLYQYPIANLSGAIITLYIRLSDIISQLNEM